MAFLGLDFIVLSSLLIIIIFSLLYFYRKKIFAFYYKQNNFDLFIQQVKYYLKTNHSKIDFNFRILQDIQTESNPQIKCFTIVDTIVQQFINAKFDTSMLSLNIKQDQLWDSYTFNSTPNGIKLPDDWAQRKKIALQRDKNICQRCGIYVKAENAQLHIIKSIKNGGKYYLENLIIVCRDCQKILDNQNIKYLNIKDELNSFVK
jgi:hypothetical protein